MSCTDCQICCSHVSNHDSGINSWLPYRLKKCDVIIALIKKYSAQKFGDECSKTVQIYMWVEPITKQMKILSGISYRKVLFPITQQILVH